MNVVSGKEILAVARSVELVEPVAILEGGDGRDEFGAFTGLGYEGCDGVCGFLGAHGRCCVVVREIGLVEGEHPGGRVGAVDEIDGGLNVSGECHHRDEGLRCVRGGRSVGDGGLEGDPVLG